MGTARMAVAVAAACVAAACGDATEGGPAPGAADDGTDPPPGSAADGGAASDGGAPQDGGPPGSCDDAPTTAPAEEAALGAWLQTRAYRCWPGESAVHPSAGPHGGNVRTFLSPALDQSMGAAGQHPQGAVAVKELYGQGTSTVTGWAVSVKTQATSEAGQGWYWYEVFSTEPGADPAFASQGEALCVNCHQGGDDFVLIPYPLQ